MRRIVPTLLLSLCFFLYLGTLAWLTVGVPFVFTSPDEHANFIFAETFMRSGDFGIADEINIPLEGIVHPRSVVIVGSFAQPGSFIGWPMIAGIFGKAAGTLGILALTPILAALGILAWGDLACVLTGDKRIATMAAVLLALHPAFWYYAARGMMHNVPFLVALVLAAWFVFTRPLSKGSAITNPHTLRTASAQIVEFAIAGIGVGTALFIRTSEVLWVVGLVALFAIVWHRHVRHLGAWIALVVGIAVPLGIMGAWNAHLYGSPFVNGYTIEDASGAPEGDRQVALAEVEATSFVEEISAMLLPFGFHPRAVLRNVWRYGMMLFPWMTVLAAAGITGILSEKRKEKSKKFSDPWRVLVWTTLGLAAWLGLVYGSWSFNDNPDPTAITIGDSHVRYWLPLFALSTLFSARALVTIVAPFSRQIGGVIAVFAGIAILSGTIVFGGPDGLLRTRSVLFQSAEKRAAVLAATEDDAIIVVDRADKFLFPYRRVIQPLRSAQTYAALPDAANLAPLYYYGIPFPESDIAYLNDVKLSALGLRIDPVMPILDEMLYRITEVVE